MKILITGHQGFIGRHLQRELVENEHDVYGVDVARDPRAMPGQGGELLRAVQCDLTLEGKVAEALAIFDPDIVIHLAAQVGRERGEDDARLTVRDNAELTTILARECAQTRTRILYASTSEVYGDQGERVCTERSPLTLPHNLYGLTKRWGEEALRLYAPDLLQIVRLSMPYGPGAPPGRGRRALDNILHQAHHRLAIPIHAGSARSWCWVGDTVRGIRLVLENGEVGHGWGVPGHGIYNIGRDDNELPMETLAAMCCDLAGAPHGLIDVIEAPARQTVVKRLSTDKLRTLGWMPGVDLEDGLPRVLEWVQGFDENAQPLTPAAAASAGWPGSF